MVVASLKSLLQIGQVMHAAIASLFTFTTRLLLAISLISTLKPQQHVFTLQTACSFLFYITSIQHHHHHDVSNEQNITRQALVSGDTRDLLTFTYIYISALN